MFATRIVKASAFLLVVTLVLSVAPGIFAQDEMSGTISWYPQFYYAPDMRPEMSAAVEAVAQDYMDLHPGVTIKLAAQPRSRLQRVAGHYDGGRNGAGYCLVPMARSQ